MLRLILKLSLGFLLLIASQACAPRAATTPDPNVIGTAIAQTRAVALTQTAQPGIPITGNESPTPTPTIPASATPFPTFTPVVIGTPQVSVSVSTNCRVGPGTAYPRVGALLVGETAAVAGRSADGRDYWIIPNPDRPGELCWLWGEHATLTGVVGVLPMFTPPPTPTPTPTVPTSTPTRTFTPTPTASLTPVLAPGFAPSYNGMESCTGTGWWVELQLQNVGGVNFQSIAMTVRDIAAGTDLSLFSEDFTNRNGCTESEARPDLPPGNTRLVSSPVFASSPAGRALRATLTLCSNPGQSGTCTTQTIDFTP